MLTVTHLWPPWAAKKVRLDSISHLQEGMVPIVLIEESSTIYDQTVNYVADEDVWGSGGPSSGTYSIPEKVTGVSLLNQGVSVDPVTGQVTANVLVSWTDNPVEDNVDRYEILVGEPV